MTEVRANEILRTKYPEATIYNGKRFGGSCVGRMVVVFKEGGKCYDYCASSYQQVLEKLGFKILYKHNVNNYNRRIEELEKKIADGGEENLFHLFDDRDWIPFTEEEILQMQKELDSLKNELATAIID